LPAPKANASFWRAKFAENRQRDRAAVEALIADGWAVMTIWECEIRSDFDGAVEYVRSAVAAA
jgi:DNA mismatch endonuclease (patch repair protein)